MASMPAFMVPWAELGGQLALVLHEAGVHDELRGALLGAMGMEETEPIDSLAQITKEEYEGR